MNKEMLAIETDNAFTILKALVSSSNNISNIEKKNLITQIAKLEWLLIKSLIDGFYNISIEKITINSEEEFIQYNLNKLNVLLKRDDSFLN